MTDQYDDNALMDTAQAAEYLNMTERFMIDTRWKGDGPRYIKIGGKFGRVRYRRADLDAWVEQHVVDPGVEREHE